MRLVMDERKILIANISKGRIGEDNSRLLGALVITKLQLAAMSRVDIPEEKRKDFYLYVDEFQNFATESFVNILSEARKYRLSLTLGNQYIAQLEEMTPTGRSTRVRDAIFGNVGTIVIFRVGAEDAEFLEKEFLPEFTANDLVNLAKYNIYLKLMINGIAGRPFSAETLPPFPQSEKPNKEKIIKVSRERYSTPQRVVEEKISRWSGVLTPSAVPAPAAPPLLYDARCSLCGKDTKVVFSPDGTRPVYCKSCRKKLEREREEKKEGISLSEAIAKEPLPFSPSKRMDAGREKIEKEKKRKTVDLEELKRALEESLEQKKDQST
jgi:CxxC-x17-CxxC domain-containing protein